MNQQFESNMFDENPLKCDCKSGANQKATSGKTTPNSTLRCCVRQKQWSMLRNRCFSDVCFVVGQAPKTQKIYAHKSVLSVSSPVFERMFSDRRSSASDSRDLEVLDIEPPAFASLLRFIYTDDIKLSANSVFQIQHAARKYAIPTLESRCTDFVKQALRSNDISLACKFLTQTELFNNRELVESCLKVIDLYPEEALRCDSFTNLDLSMLRRILERDSLEVDEVDLFTALLSWSAAECWRKDLDVSPENQKFVLEDALSSVRFPLMTEAEFALLVVPSKLLSDDEVAYMSLHFKLVNARSSTRSSKTLPRSSGKISKKRRSSLPFCSSPRVKNKTAVVKISPASLTDDLNSDKARSEATFSVTVKNVSALKDKRLSPPFYVRNLPWRISVMQRSTQINEKNQLAFGFFLQCDGKPSNITWNCVAFAELKMLPQTAGVEPISRKIQHLFSNWENDWGFSHFMAWNDMVDRNKGYIKDDSVILEVRLSAAEPHGL